MLCSLWVWQKNRLSMEISGPCRRNDNSNNTTAICSVKMLCKLLFIDMENYTNNSVAVFAMWWRNKLDCFFFFVACISSHAVRWNFEQLSRQSAATDSHTATIFHVSPQPNCRNQWHVAGAISLCNLRSGARAFFLPSSLSFSLSHSLSALYVIIL